MIKPFKRKIHLENEIWTYEIRNNLRVRSPDLKTTYQIELSDLHPVEKPRITPHLVKAFILSKKEKRAWDYFAECGAIKVFGHTIEKETLDWFRADKERTLEHSKIVIEIFEDAKGNFLKPEELLNALYWANCGRLWSDNFVPLACALGALHCIKMLRVKGDISSQEFLCSLT